MLYSMGLDLDAIIPRATRTTATVIAAVVATAFVFFGSFEWDVQSAMTSFVLLLTAIGTPWAVITLIGHVRCRGVYDPDALQVFNRRARGGVYWYTGGWNLRATVSWAAGAAVGLAAVSTPVYEGPLLALTSGVDCSFILSGLVGGVVYAALTLRPRAALTADPAGQVAVAVAAD